MSIKNILSPLFNLNEVELNIYNELFYTGPLSATHLAKSINISRTSIYDHLDSLVEKGLVSESQKSGIKIFLAQPPSKIQLLLNEKKQELNQASRQLEKLSELYQQQKSVKPNLQLFEGRKELQQMMKDMLLYRDIEVLAFWPIKNVIKVLSQDFIKEFHIQRIKRNISIKAIWPNGCQEYTKKHSFLKPGKNFNRQLRIAPSRIKFDLGYAVYQNTVRFISSSKESYGFIVESEELTEMMKTQFQFIWEQAKSINQ